MAELYNVAQLIAEVGRLHMENLALRADRELMMQALQTMAGPASAGLADNEAEGPVDEGEDAGPAGPAE